MREIPLVPAACGALAALFMLSGPLRPRPELIVESARPGEVVEMRARWRTGDGTTPIRRLVTPFRMRLPRRGTFEGEFVAVDAHTPLRLTVVRPGLLRETMGMPSEGVAVRTTSTEEAFGWSIGSQGGGTCGDEGWINPTYRPLEGGTPLCLFAERERKCDRAQAPKPATPGYRLLLHTRSSSFVHR
jgi:hypothetical protein